MANRYPRDMIGHGATPPNAAWPNGAKIAVQFVVNYEEGGENNVLHGDAVSEAFLSEIVGAAAWEGQRHWNMESIYEYGARAGFWRLHRLFTGAGIRPTVYGVGTALMRSPEQVRAMQAADWEIASHGLKWIEYKDFTEAEERAHMMQAVDLHRQVTGAAPRGWYTGRCSVNTVDLAAQTGKFDYISDSYADDLPYWIKSGSRDQLIIPYTLDANDMRFATPQGFNAGEQFESYLRDSFDCLYEEGEAGAPKMMSIGLHCRLIGRPGRVQALKRFIAYAQSHADVWFPTRLEIAEHWAATHPPQPLVRPSEMDAGTFADTYGGIFEHSAWVAERAYNLELGPAFDTGAGLHAAMVQIFCAATQGERMKVLRAHPDLAGKLAAAKRLTAESTSEQASAGLDALTDAERSQFTQMNDDYTAKHKFPFIIAVRDHNKASILDAFDRRIRNDTDTEFAEACRQVERIAEFRLKEILP